MRDRMTFRPEFIVADAFVKAEHTTRNFSRGAGKGVHLRALLFIALIVIFTSDVATFGAAKKNVRAYLQTRATIECSVTPGPGQNDPFSIQVLPSLAHFI